MLAQYRATIRLDLAEGHGRHPRTFEAEAESADPREQIEHAHSWLPDIARPVQQRAVVFVQVQQP